MFKRWQPNTIITINCLDPDPAHRKILCKILKTLDIEKKALTDPKYEGVEIAPGEHRTVILTHRIACRSSESDKENRLRYEVYDDKAQLGYGDFGSVYRVLATIKIADNDRLIIKKHKSRIAKISKNISEKHLDMAKKESFITNITQHLRGKKLSQSSDYMNTVDQRDSVSITVMAYKKGKKVKDVLASQLTTRQRIELTHALLQAYHEQLYSSGVVHRDLHDQNILASIRKDGIKVSYIDLGFAKHSSTGDKHEQGTILYAAPESLRDKKSDYKSDLFSIGMLIARMWGADENFGFTPDLAKMFNEKKDPSYIISIHGLFTGMNDLPSDLKVKISGLIQSLTCTDQNSRPSTVEAMNKSFDIRKHYFLQLEGVSEYAINHATILANNAPTLAMLAQHTRETPDRCVEQYVHELLGAMNDVPDSPHCLDYFITLSELPIPYSYREDKEKCRDYIKSLVVPFKNRALFLDKAVLIGDSLMYNGVVDPDRFALIWKDITEQKEKYINASELKYSTRDINWDNVNQAWISYRAKGDELAELLIDEIQSPVIKNIAKSYQVNITGNKLIDIKNDYRDALLEYTARNKNNVSAEIEHSVNQILSIITDATNSDLLRANLKELTDKIRSSAGTSALKELADKVCPPEPTRGPAPRR